MTGERATSRCGRLDNHPAHNWTRPKHANAYISVVRAADYHCPGRVVQEGGSWTCLECSEPLVEGSYCVVHGRRR